jgi:hypothetical protein
MKEPRRGRGPKASPRNTSEQGGLALLESEVAELREKNVRLQERLEEAETRAELQARADRILAIPPPTDR